MDDFMELLSKPLINAVKEFSDAQVYIKAIQSVKTKLNNFKSEHGKIITTVRHTAIAHRDQNMFIQLQTINLIDWYEATGILGEYDTIVRDLGQVCQQLMNRSADELHQNGTTPKE